MRLKAFSRIRSQETVKRCLSLVVLAAVVAGVVAFVLPARFPTEILAYSVAGIIQIALLRESVGLFRCLGRGITIEGFTGTYGKIELASELIAVEVLVRAFLLLCAFLSSLALLRFGTSFGPVGFFLLLNVAAGEFGRVSLKNARDAVKVVPARNYSDTIKEARPAKSAHWWTDTQLREETKVRARR